MTTKFTGEKVKIILIVAVVLALIGIVAWLVIRSAMQDIDDDY